MLSEHVLKGGLNVLLLGLEKTLSQKATRNELRWQHQVHSQVPGIGVPTDNPGQYTDEHKNFKPNQEQAEERARHTIRIGVGNRLKGAIAMYESGDQMECLRHMIIALDVVCDILDWKEASAWCNRQNQALFAERQKKQAA